MCVSIEHGLGFSLGLRVACLGAVSFALAILQDQVSLSATAKTRLAWSYGFGMILTVSNWPWLQDLLTAHVQDENLRATLSLLDLTFPGLILISVATLYSSALRCSGTWQGRAYLLSGLGLLGLYTARVWFHLYSNHFAETTFGNLYWAVELWAPACLMVATAGIFLGCLPHELHRRSRLAIAMTVSHLLGSTLVLLGLCVIGPRFNSYAFETLLAVLLGALAPAAFLMRRWVFHTYGLNSH